jgi:hypothetical protein
MPKRLELLSELAPHAGLIALLVNPNGSIAQRIIGNMQEASTVKISRKQLQRHIGPAGGSKPLH